jgi:hypothetical protein
MREGHRVDRTAVALERLGAGAAARVPIIVCLVVRS